MKKVLKVLNLVLIMILISTNIVLATDDATSFEGFINQTTVVTNDVGSALSSVLLIIQVIGISVAVIMLIALAIKYMVSSVSDRAEIKKHAVVYVVGALLLFGASGIVEIIKTFSKNIR